MDKIFFKEFCWKEFFWKEFCWKDFLERILLERILYGEKKEKLEPVQKARSGKLCLLQGKEKFYRFLLLMIKMIQ